MKHYRPVHFFMVIVFAIGCTLAHGRQHTQTAKTKQLVALDEGRAYKFMATYVYPVRGRARNLTPDNYTVIFSKDTLNAQLPYFGVVTAATYGAKDMGVHFGTKNFTLTQSAGKKGTLTIQYTLKGSPDVATFTMHIYSDGTTDINVRFLQREPISYRGIVEEIALP